MYKKLLSMVFALTVAANVNAAVITKDVSQDDKNKLVALMVEKIDSGKTVDAAVAEVVAAVEAGTVGLHLRNNEKAVWFVLGFGGAIAAWGAYKGVKWGWNKWTAKKDKAADTPVDTPVDTPAVDGDID